jgi:hypothetical protein
MTNLTIDRLALKLSGLSQQEGQHLAQLIAQRLAEGEITNGMMGDRPHLHIAIQPAENASPDWLADQIATEILQQLNRTLV